MTPAQIDVLLGQQFVGRIGCASKGRPYVVPVFYAYHDGAIYCQSREGLKLGILRENKEVCMLIDAIDNFSNWRSAVCWGRFTEIKSSAAIKRAAAIIEAKFLPLSTGEQVTHLPESSHPPQVVEKRPKSIYFKIVVEDMSGRFEKN